MSEQGAWSIDFTRPGRRSLRLIPPRVLEAAMNFIYGPLTQTPYLRSKPLKAPLEPKRSANVGPYRIILTIDDETRTVHIYEVVHRADAYRTR